VIKRKADHLLLFNHNPLLSDFVSLLCGSASVLYLCAVPLYLYALLLTDIVALLPPSALLLGVVQCLEVILPYFYKSLQHFWRFLPGLISKFTYPHAKSIRTGVAWKINRTRMNSKG